MLSYSHSNDTGQKLYSILWYRITYTTLYKILDTALQAGSSRGEFPMVSLEFFIDIILPAALCPWGRPSLSQI